jgi:uncharacterized protein (TIGR02265 family)
MRGAGLGTFFISYAHGSAEDEELCARFADALAADGHDVFCDLWINVGTDWAEEIECHLRNCDFFLLLLSSNALSSTMVMQEVERACNRRKQEGAPVLLTIRVNLDGELPYRWAACLDSYKWQTLRSELDFDPILRSIRDVARGPGARHARPPPPRPAPRRRWLPWPSSQPTRAESAAPARASVDASVMESISRLLKAKGDCREQLLAAGFDVEHPNPSYPPSVLLAVLDTSWKHLYPEMSREQAHRRIGQDFVARYAQTILGKVSLGLISFLGAERYIRQCPKLASMSTAGLEVWAEPVRKGEFRIVYRGSPDMSLDFTVGTMEAAAWASHFKTRFEIIRREPSEFEVRATVGDCPGLSMTLRGNPLGNQPRDLRVPGKGVRRSAARPEHESAEQG